MKVAVLAVQGAFIEHEKVLGELGVETIELRKKEDLKKSYDGLILPGGESTTQGKLLHELGMFDHIKTQIQNGLPVLATCAGLILLAKDLSNDERTYFQTLPVTVKRNAYGRQLGSFFTVGEVKGMGEIPMEFIRAPYIEEVDEDVEVLAKVEENIVAVKYRNQLAMSFHPELTQDRTVHAYFVEKCIQGNEMTWLAEAK